MHPNHTNDFKIKNGIILLILTALVIITFANSLDNAFISDDIAEIAQKETLGDLGYIIRTYYLGIIRHLIYWATYHIAGLTPFAFRLTNILFHLSSTFLVFYILSFISKSRRIAFFSASLFAVHPAISEAVVWVSGGMYPQYTFFFLLSFLFYLLSDRKKKYYFFSIACFLFALMSHGAMPLPLFLVFPLYEFAFGKLKKNWIKSIPYLTLALVYFFLTLVGLSERTQTLQSVHYQERGIDNLFILIPVAISSYLELTFWPKTLTLYHSELIFGQFEFAMRALITLIFLGITLVSFKFNKFIFFFLSLFWLALSPTLTPFRLNWIVAERYLYLPILGILAVLGLMVLKLEQFLKLKWSAYIIVTLIIILLSARTMLRNIDWKNEDNLWIATGKTSPSSPNTHNNLGDMYGRWGDKQRALQEFQKAIELKPNYGDAYHNLANTYRELGQLDKALENYQKAANFNPNLWQSYQNIAALYFQSKQYDLALEFIQKAIQINPKNINLRNNLGIVYLVSGDKEKAKEIFNLVLSVDPQNQLARQGLIEASK